MWNNIEATRICITGIPEREELEEVVENLFEEIMVENFPKQVQETSRSRKFTKFQKRRSPKDQFRSDQISRSVVSDSLRLHESQHARPPCPSSTPGVHSDSRPSSQ